MRSWRAERRRPDRTFARGLGSIAERLACLSQRAPSLTAVLGERSKPTWHPSDRVCESHSRHFVPAVLNHTCVIRARSVRTQREGVGGLVPVGPFRRDEVTSTERTRAVGRGNFTMSLASLGARPAPDGPALQVS